MCFIFILFQLDRPKSFLLLFCILSLRSEIYCFKGKELFQKHLRRRQKIEIQRLITKERERKKVIDAEKRKKVSNRQRERKSTMRDRQRERERLDRLIDTDR